MSIIEQKRDLDDSPEHDVLISHAAQGDEISLLDIFQILSRQRKIVLFFIVFFSFASFAVAMLLPRLYRSEIVVLPPFAMDAEYLSVPKFYETTVEGLYGKFIQNLQSISLQKEFFDKNNLYSMLQTKNGQAKDKHEIFYKQFHNLLNVKNNAVANNNTYTISLDGREQVQIVDWLNSFVLLVDNYTIQQVVSSIMAKVEVREGTVRKKIENLRRIARQRRLDRIAVLEEATAVAGKLQLKNPVGIIYSYRQEIKDTKVDVVNIKETPNYLRGTHALEAEVEVLEKRKNDDPFIVSLRDLQEEISFYQGITLTGRGLHAARIDQEAVALERPVKPNRNLIVVLGCIVGVIVGFIVAFIKNAYPDVSSSRSES